MARREARERHDSRGELSRPLRPRGLAREHTRVVVADRDRTRRRRNDDPVGLHVLERLDHRLRHRYRRRAVPAVQLRQPAAPPAFDHVDLGAERLQDPCGGVARARKEVVDDARREHRDLHRRRRGVGLRDLARPVVQRVVGDRGKALLPRDRSERQTDAAVAPQRVLERGEPARQPVDPLGGRPLSQEDALRPRHPGLLDGLRPDVGDEGGERDPDRADRVAGIAAHAERLLERDALGPVVPRRDDQADRAGVDMTEDVAADLEIAGADVAARAAADAPERVAKEGVLASRSGRCRAARSAAPWVRARRSAS